MPIGVASSNRDYRPDPRVRYGRAALRAGRDPGPRRRMAGLVLIVSQSGSRGLAGRARASYVAREASSAAAGGVAGSRLPPVTRSSTFSSKRASSSVRAASALRFAGRRRGAATGARAGPRPPRPVCIRPATAPRFHPRDSRHRRLRGVAHGRPVASELVLQLRVRVRLDPVPRERDAARGDDHAHDRRQSDQHACAPAPARRHRLGRVVSGGLGLSRFGCPRPPTDQFGREESDADGGGQVQRRAQPRHGHDGNAHDGEVRALQEQQLGAAPRRARDEPDDPGDRHEVDERECHFSNRDVAPVGAFRALVHVRAQVEVPGEVVAKDEQWDGRPVSHVVERVVSVGVVELHLVAVREVDAGEPAVEHRVGEAFDLRASSE